MYWKTLPVPTVEFQVPYFLSYMPIFCTNKTELRRSIREQVYMM